MITDPVAAACGCEWGGAFCPHCGRSIVNDSHVTRCHEAAIDAPVVASATVHLRDPLLTVAEVAARLNIAPATWRAYVSRGQAPAPDDPDAGRPSTRGMPRWKTSTVDAWRPPSG